MKSLLLKENLKKGLGIIIKAIGKNLNLPILNNVLISAEKNFLNLTTTNLEISIKYWLLSKTEKEGKISIPAKFLHDFISSIPGDKLTLEVQDQNLFINYDNNSTQIKGQSVEDFPIIPEIKEKSFLEINITPFYQGLSRVVDFCSLNQARPEISGVYFNFKKDRLYLAATDSFRLAEKVLIFEKSLSSEKEYSFILPQKSAREIMNILTEESGSTDKESRKLRVYFSSNQVMFEHFIKETSHPQFQFTSRLIEGEYPNYQEIIPQKYETRIILEKDKFLNQLKITSLFCGKTNEIQVSIDVQKKNIEIFAQNPDLGENRVSLQGEVNGENVKTSFNCRFLIDGLLNMKSQEVIFELNKEDGPAVLRPVGDNTYTHVIMPIKGS